MVRSKTCERGRNERVTVEESKGTMEQAATTFETKLLCMSIAPFGHPLVPAPLARLRTNHRVRLLPPVRHDRVRGVDRQAARQPLRGEPAPLRRGPSRLREDLRTRAGNPLEVLARQAEAL